MYIYCVIYTIRPKHDDTAIFSDEDVIVSGMWSQCCNCPFNPHI